MKFSYKNYQKYIYSIFAVMLLFTFACEQNTTEPEDVPAIDFQMETVDGDTLKLSDTLGKIVILQFMQWDCEACQSEVPVLNQIYEEYSRNEVEVWAISILHSSPQVLENLKENFINEFNPRYPILIDNVKYTSIPVSQAYSVDRTPTTVIIGKEGYMEFYYDASTVTKESFDAWIERLK